MAPSNKCDNCGQLSCVLVEIKHAQKREHGYDVWFICGQCYRNPPIERSARAKPGEGKKKPKPKKVHPDEVDPLFR